jgi:hypothetical protein
MHRKYLLALLGAAAIAVALAGSALASSAGPTVTIRLEGLNKTLLLPTLVRGRSGFITKFGAPPGKCSGKTLQGALDVATHGHWRGTWNAQFNEYFIASILGEKPKGSNYWEIFVGNVAASFGACDLKLHAGEQFLFADENGNKDPSSLQAPRTAIAGTAFKVKLVGYNAKGKAHSLAHVRVTGNGIKAATTNGHGIATITDQQAGVLVLRAGPAGFVRTEAIVHVAA